MEFGSEVRSRYPGARRCACSVDGQACSPGRVSVRVMNFGQRWRTPGIVDVQYRIELPRAFVLDVLGEHLPDYVDDSRNFPDPDSAIDRALQAADWPSAAEVLNMPELAHHFIRFYGYELLGHWVGGAAGEHDWVLNTIDRIELAEDVVALSGTARRAGTPVRYQDD